MSIFLKQLITNTLKGLSPKEVIQYGHRYGFNVSHEEANKITKFLKNHSIDPFSSVDRKNAFQELANITSPETAKKAEKLFTQLVSSYGLDSLFN